MFDELKSYYYISYDLITPSGLIGPDILFKIVSYFEENNEKLREILQKKKIDHDFIGNFNIFIEWLNKLPEPFLGQEVVKDFNNNPTISSAQKIAQKLPFNKRTIFTKFLSLLQLIANESIYPIDFDSVFCYPFTHSPFKTSFFNIITKQNDFMCFPYSSIKSFIPVNNNKIINEDFDIGSINVEITKSEINDDKLIDLYNRTKRKAKEYGINEDIINNIETIDLYSSFNYKKEIKQVLNQFESEFQNITNKQCLKKDKLFLSSLYKFNMMLRKDSYVKLRNQFLLKQKHKIQKELLNNKNRAQISEISKEYQRIKKELEELSNLIK